MGETKEDGNEAMDSNGGGGQWEACHIAEGYRLGKFLTFKGSTADLPQGKMGANLALPSPEINQVVSKRPPWHFRLNLQTKVFQGSCKKMSLKAIFSPSRRHRDYSRRATILGRLPTSLQGEEISEECGQISSKCN